MPKTLYVDSDPETSSDANPGTHPLRPKRTLNGAMAIAQAKDTVLLRKGRLYDGASSVKVNDITLDAYSLGTELATAPTLRLGKGLGTCLTVSGVGVTVNSLDIWEADIGLQVTGAGFTSEGVHVHRFGLGIVVKASGVHLKDPCFFQGRMKSNTGSKTDAGAQAIVLWKEPNVPHMGTTITGAYAEDLYAYALAFPGKPDGAMVEIFGGVEDVLIKDCVGRNLSTFMEVGGTTARKETARNVRVVGCLIDKTLGRVLFVNAPDDDFFVDWYGFAFEDNTLIADDDKASPFFIAGAQSSLTHRLSVKRNIIMAAAQVYNAGAGTDIGSLVHEGNVYYRPDGGKTLGVSLHRTEVFRAPSFSNAAAHDYRLTPDAALVGAMGLAQAFEGEIALSGLMRSPKAPYAANELIGGHHAVPRWQDMVAIPRAYRMAGMTCTVLQHRMTYELHEDRVTWLKIRGRSV